MNRVPLFEEYRLIERSENQINGAWKGAHLLLFFLAFVFGSFCTFCFHMLMYLFDEKCVLFPKLLSLTSMRHNVIYEFIPSNKEFSDLPVDFLSTQWVEKSTCSLPTYVPLVSGIFGLVWTTMFLMCSTGSRTLSGLQRPWRVLPPVFVFSLAMGGLCIYSSAVTHNGLQQLCLKLGEITGSSTCTFTVNVATLTYERRIRGVYQATRLTILSAWLHTACWLLSALLALVRVLLVVDFQLVRVNVQLHGDIDKILEKHEIQLRTVSPDGWVNENIENPSNVNLSNAFENQDRYEESDRLTNLYTAETELLYLAKHEGDVSELSLVPEERDRIARVEAYRTVPKDKTFIVKWLYDILETLDIPEHPGELSEMSYTLSKSGDKSLLAIARQLGQERFLSVQDTSKATEKPEDESQRLLSDDDLEIKGILKSVDSLIIHESKIRKARESSVFQERTRPKPSTSKQPDHSAPDKHITPESTSILDIAGPSRSHKSKKKQDFNRKQKKTNLKHVGVQTEKGKKKKRRLRVLISEKKISDTDDETSTVEKTDVDKETQTREKEKQD